MRYVIGLDIHKRETQACIANEKGTILEEKRFATKPASFKKALRKYANSDALIESVGFHRPVAKWLQDQGHTVHQVHVGGEKRPRIKSDRRDAQRLAKRFVSDELTMAYLPPEEVQRIRNLARHRRYLGETSGGLKTKIKHDLLKHGHFLDDNPVQNEEGRDWIEAQKIPEVSSSLRLLRAVQSELLDYEKRLEKESTEDPTAKLLMTTPGIGTFLALLILAEVGDFARFKDKDGIGAYAGLVPSRIQSGDTDHFGPITKTGNDNLRWALVEAANQHVRVCPESQLSKRYRHLKDTRGKGHKKAIDATARVLGSVLWTLVHNQEPFKVNP